MKILLSTAAAAALFAVFIHYAEADDGWTVFCESIMRPGVVQQFNGSFCPNGWTPA